MPRASKRQGPTKRSNRVQAGRNLRQTRAGAAASRLSRQAPKPETSSANDANDGVSRADIDHKDASALEGEAKSPSDAVATSAGSGGPTPARPRRERRGKYKGVKNVAGGQFGAFIYARGTVHDLGEFPTAVKAARAYDRAALRMHGDGAVLNFLDSHEVQSDESDSHNDVCEVCAAGGDLLCCDGCDCVYHKTCLHPELTEVPSGEWLCPVCTLRRKKDVLVGCANCLATDVASVNEFRLHLQRKCHMLARVSERTSKRRRTTGEPSTAASEPAEQRKSRQPRGRLSGRRAAGPGEQEDDDDETDEAGSDSSEQDEGTLDVDGRTGIGGGPDSDDSSYHASSADGDDSGGDTRPPSKRGRRGSNQRGLRSVGDPGGSSGSRKRGRSKRGGTRTGMTRYRGVRRRASGFRAQVKIGGETRALGTFATAKEAARAYDLAALRIFGPERAVLNLPEEHADVLSAAARARSSASRPHAGRAASDHKDPKALHRAAASAARRAANAMEDARVADVVATRAEATAAQAAADLASQLTDRRSAPVTEVSDSAETSDAPDSSAPGEAQSANSMLSVDKLRQQADQAAREAATYRSIAAAARKKADEARALASEAAAAAEASAAPEEDESGESDGSGRWCAVCNDDPDVECTACGCRVCRGKHSLETILLCDGCDGEFHTECLVPPLEAVPDSDWYCPACERTRKRKRTAGTSSALSPRKGSSATRSDGSGGSDDGIRTVQRSRYGRPLGSHAGRRTSTVSGTVTSSGYTLSAEAIAAIERLRAAMGEATSNDMRAYYRKEIKRVRDRERRRRRREEERDMSSSPVSTPGSYGGYANYGTAGPLVLKSPSGSGQSSPGTFTPRSQWSLHHGWGAWSPRKVGGDSAGVNVERPTAFSCATVVLRQRRESAVCSAHRKVDKLSDAEFSVASAAAEVLGREVARSFPDAAVRHAIDRAAEHGSEDQLVALIAKLEESRASAQSNIYDKLWRRRRRPAKSDRPPLKLIVRLPPKPPVASVVDGDAGVLEPSMALAIAFGDSGEGVDGADAGANPLLEADDSTARPSDSREQQSTEPVEADVPLPASGGASHGSEPADLGDVVQSMGTSSVAGVSPAGDAKGGSASPPPVPENVGVASGQETTLGLPDGEVGAAAESTGEEPTRIDGEAVDLLEETGSERNKEVTAPTSASPSLRLGDDGGLANFGGRASAAGMASAELDVLAAAAQSTNSTADTDASMAVPNDVFD